MVMSKDVELHSPDFASRKRIGRSGWSSPKAISHSLLLGSVLFSLGLISLLTGHIASDIEWSQFRIRGHWRSKKGGYRVPIDIWKSEFSNLYYGCSDRGPNFISAVRKGRSNGYLLIATSGGLNQQRTGITDAVVVARILNATLVVPELDHDSFWKDESDFANIFDVNWFISYLSKDVTIVKRIPDKVMRSMEKPPYTMRPPRKSTPEYYLDVALPILLRRRALQLTKFDYRLTNELDEELQKLRCRVNYHALRFTKPIQGLGQKLVKKMRRMSSRFIAVHLRFEPDMLAFSGCYYGGGEKERDELSEIRKRWETLPEDVVKPDMLAFSGCYYGGGEKERDELSEIRKRWETLPEDVVKPDMLAFSGCYYGGGEKERDELSEIRKRWETLPDLNAEDERDRGKCPLTPFEVGLMLRALGFGNNTYLYVASGEIYGGEDTLQPLRNLFPNFYNKEMLAGEDLKPYLPFSSRLAAIDYIVSDESDVFVTNNNGNMAKILAGRRRYMGHKRTIRPNAKKLSSLFKGRIRMNWQTFSNKVKSAQKGFMGEPDEMRPGRGEFHEFPTSCICQTPAVPEGLPELGTTRGETLPTLTK